MASIHFICPVCNQSLKVSASLAGRKGRCPFCAAKVRIPVDDHGTAEVLDAAANNKAGSDVAAAPPAGAPAGVQDARGLKGAGDMLPSIEAGIRADDGIPSMGPRAPSAATAAPSAAAPVADSLQQQLDQQLGAAAPEHNHKADAATLKYGQDIAPPVIEAEDGDRTRLPGEIGAPPPPANTAATPEAAAPDLPAAKIETIKYAPENNPVRTSAELRGLKTQNFEPGAPPAAQPPAPEVLVVTAPVSLAIPPPGHEHLTVAAPPGVKASDGLPDLASTLDRRVKGSEALPAAARTAALDDMLAVNSDNQVGDVLAGLPRERSAPTSAVANLGSLHPPGADPPAQSPVTAVQGATMQSPAAKAGGAAARGRAAAGSLIGDKCDPSRAGVSAAPLIVWVALVILVIGGLTAWLVVDGLAQREATLRRSRAFLRVSDLAVAEQEYCSASRAPSSGSPADSLPAGSLPVSATPASGVPAVAPPETHALSLAALQERQLLNPALWREVYPTPTPAAPAGDAASAPGVELARDNGYRYVLWFKKMVPTGPAGRVPQSLAVADGFAVAAIPTDAANWAFAIDERGRMITWWYTPPTPLPPDAPGAASIGPGPVAAGIYPADSDFDKLPIR